MIKAVLFDLDGVLVDAVKLHQKAFIEALKPHKEITEEYHMQHLNGLPTKKKLEKLGFNTDLIEEINISKQEITFKIIPELINPIPSVLRTVEEVKKRGIRFAVCSNSIRKSTELLLEHGGISGFEFIISNQEVIYPKPNPEMYLKAIERLGLDKSEVLIVEDSPVGLEAARKSGAQICEIKNPYDIEKLIMLLEKNIAVLTHRGLEPSNPNFYAESSYESFKSQLERGFGIEFDVNFAKDEIIIFHDGNLGRITSNQDTREFKDLTVSEIKNLQLKGQIATFDEIIHLIKDNKSGLNALHLKGKYQDILFLNKLIERFQKYPEIISKIIVFDLKPEAARYMKLKIKEIQTAPSIAHPFDIKRYGSFVSNTLITLDEALRFKQEGIYDWAWLDEWDTLDENNRQKLLYTRENFNKLRAAGYKIALVTPELHSTSPGLLGGESHVHARDKAALFNRINEIITLNPDAICTDYPEESKKMIENSC